ncbi:hypothetical protein [Streptomyces bauhiniae]|nr:hypothetical protein [Streptomyces bauhiniae]
MTVALVESTAAASEDALCARWVRARPADTGRSPLRVPAHPE